MSLIRRSSATFLLVLIALLGSIYAFIPRKPNGDRLTAAAHDGSVLGVTRWLAAGSDPNFVSPDGKTPLTSAAVTGNIWIVRLLLADGANVRIRSQDGYSVLHAVALHRNVRLARLLLAAGADVNARMTNGTTPLEVAISSMYSSSDMTMILIQAGADVKAADSEGGTPLWSAVDEEPPHVVEELLKRGASPNVQIHSTGFSGWTPLHLAAMHGLKDHVELLLRYGADPTITNDEGQTALDVLMTSKYPSEEREIIANALKTNSLGSY